MGSTGYAHDGQIVSATHLKLRHAGDRNMGMKFPGIQTRTGAVGVAFGDHDVRMLQVRVANGRLGVTGAAHRAPAMDEHDQTRLATVLREAIVGGGFTGRRCIVSLPCRDVFLQSTQLPMMPDGELAEAVAWEASQRMGVAREAIQSDWIRTGAIDTNGQSRAEVLMIAARRETLDMRLEALVEAGLRPVAVDTGFSALARLLSRHHRRDADRDTCRAVLDVGDTATTVMVLQGDSIAFCKRIDVGGHDMDANVAERLCLDTQSAGELRLARLQPGSAGIDPTTDRALREAIRPLATDLARQVLLCLRYASVTFRGLTPTRLISTGTHGHEPGVIEALEATCNVAVHGDDASRTIADLREGLAARKYLATGSPGAWTVAAGLSLRSLEHGSALGRASSRSRGRSAA